MCLAHLLINQGQGNPYKNLMESYNEGSNALYRQSSNGHFQLRLASNWLKFYCESSKYPYRDLSKVSNNYCYRYFQKKINVILQIQSIFLLSKEKCTFYRHAPKIIVNVF